MSEVPVSPTRRRRWCVGMLLLVIALGGGVWWRFQLTPEEKLLVGRWRSLERSPNGGPIIASVFEFRRSRRVYKNGVEWAWSAENEQFTVREPELQRLYRVLSWSGFMPSLTNEKTLGRIQFINHDLVNITLRNMKTGQDANTLELKRIVEK